MKREKPLKTYTQRKLKEVTKFEKGTMLRVIGPLHFPFDHLYVVVQPTKFWTASSRMLATTTTLRLTEYHGGRRSYLIQHKYTGAWRLTGADKHLATEFEVEVILDGGLSKDEKAQAAITYSNLAVKGFHP